MMGQSPDNVESGLIVTWLKKEKDWSAMGAQNRKPENKRLVACLQHDDPCETGSQTQIPHPFGRVSL